MIFLQNGNNKSSLIFLARAFSSFTVVTRIKVVVPPTTSTKTENKTKSKLPLTRCRPDLISYDEA